MVLDGYNAEKIETRNLPHSHAELCSHLFQSAKKNIHYRYIIEWVYSMLYLALPLQSWTCFLSNHITLNISKGQLKITKQFYYTQKLWTYTYTVRYALPWSTAHSPTVQQWIIITNSKHYCALPSTVHSWKCLKINFKGRKCWLYAIMR